MENNTAIVEFFELPSLGKVYTTEISPEVQLRSMTALDEMKRLSPSDKPYQTLCNVIDGCIVSEKQMSSYDMCIGDYQYLLYKLRTVTYGPEYKGTAVCPYCNAKNEGSFSLDNLPIKRYSEEVEKYRRFVLPGCGKQIQIRMRTPRMLDITQQKLKEAKLKNNLINATLMYSIESIIEEIDGMAPNKAFLEDWIRGLNMKDINMIIQYSDALDASIGVDNRLFYDCDTCGLTFKSFLRQDNEFFRPSLELGWDTNWSTII